MAADGKITVTSEHVKNTLSYDPFKKWMFPIKGHAFLQQEQKGEKTEIGGAFGLLIRRDRVGTSFLEAMEEPSDETMNLALDLFDRYGCFKRDLSHHRIRKGSGVWQSELSAGNFLIIESVTIKKSYRRKGVGKRMIMDILKKAMSLNDDVRFVFAYPTCLHAGEDLEDRAGRTKRERFNMAQSQSATAIRFFRASGFRRVGLSHWFALAVEDKKHPSRAVLAEDDPDPAQSEAADSDWDSDDSQPEVPKTRISLGGLPIDEDGNFDFQASPSSNHAFNAAVLNSRQDQHNKPSRFEREYPIHHALKTLSDVQCLKLLKARSCNNALPGHLYRMRDNEKNTILHVAAKFSKTDCVSWILNTGVSGTRDLRNDRNLQGYTPLELLYAQLETTRLGRFHGSRLIIRADEFGGFGEEAVLCVLALRGWPLYDLSLRAQARFGCSCGLCLGGFLSRRMCDILQSSAEEILGFMEFEDETDKKFWYDLNKDFLQHVPEKVRVGFKKNKVLRKGFRAFLTAIIECLSARNIPTEDNLMSIHRKNRLWPQMHAFYFIRGGSIEAATNIVLDHAIEEFSHSDVFPEEYDLQPPKLPACRNDFEFELVRRQCTRVSDPAPSSEVTMNQLISLQAPWLPKFMEMMQSDEPIEWPEM